MICSAYMKARCLWLVSSDKCPNYSVHYRSCKNYFPIRRCLIAQTFINCKLVPNPYQDRISLHDFHQQLIQIPDTFSASFFPFSSAILESGLLEFPSLCFCGKSRPGIKILLLCTQKTLHTNDVNNLGNNKANQNMGTFMQGCPIPKGREVFKGRQANL